ncbi:LysM peptidoglycan-binding domain-containing protein [Lachnoclostridium sp. Marseille-P6806]|uniref:LysM peptidoglycan-binding domain-containing protein n=1 Tax=Lachnoclostridium sp. Marseille-P6806 TaxID=2364793 RepID=UPI003569F0EE
MGELYNPYPSLPKNIRQIGERDQAVKLYVEDYVNTYLKRLYPTGGQDLRVGLLVGECRIQDGIPFLFADGALEMENVAREGQKVEFTEEAWKRAYEVMEQMFPKRSILGWFLCGTQGSTLSPLNYWKQHGQYFAGKHQLMYLNSGLEGEEAVYMASEDGFYRLQGYCIYYERNQMMQDYMVSRKDARRVETGNRDTVIRDFRQKMEDKKTEAVRTRSAVGALGTACGVLAVLALAGGVVSFNNYQKMKAMETVIASAVPEGTWQKWSNALTTGENGGEVEVEEVPGQVYPTQAGIVIETEGSAEASGQNSVLANGMGGNATAAGTGSGESFPENAGAAAETGAAALDAPDRGAGTGTSDTQDRGAGTGASDAQGANAGTGASDAQGANAGTGTSALQEAAPVQIPADAVQYTVKKGETLYGICMERYRSMEPIGQICQWNGLADENRLSAGQELYLPAVGN